MVYQDTIHNLRLQSAQGIRLSVSEPDKALGIVQSAGWECTLQEGMLHCAGVSDRDVARLVRLLVELDHDIYRVEEQRKSLEDIFMRIVGKGVS
jgi:ABC-2 type transport system ATP-binding protein